MSDPVEILGQKEVIKTLAKVSPAEGNRIARRTVTRIARMVRDEVRKRAPKETGNLRKSIKSRRVRGKPGEAGAEVWVDRSGGKSGKGYHWHFIEFGTQKMKAQPFTHPTVESFRPRIPELYRREWWEQYRKEMVKRNRKKPKGAR